MVSPYPIGCMYGICTYMYPNVSPNPYIIYIIYIYIPFTSTTCGPHYTLRVPTGHVQLLQAMAWGLGALRRLNDGNLDGTEVKMQICLPRAHPWD